MKWEMGNQISLDFVCNEPSSRCHSWNETPLPLLVLLLPIMRHLVGAPALMCATPMCVTSSMQIKSRECADPKLMVRLRSLTSLECAENGRKSTFIMLQGNRRVAVHSKKWSALRCYPRRSIIDAQPVPVLSITLIYTMLFFRKRMRKKKGTQQVSTRSSLAALVTGAGHFRILAVLSGSDALQ